VTNYPPPYQPAPVQNSTTATISLISGILGLTVFPLIGSIIALITGYMAKGEIQRSAGTLGGDSAANIGIILGWVGVGLTVVGTICAICLIFSPILLSLPFMFTSGGS
jgi:hypothetical protein